MIFLHTDVDYSYYTNPETEAHLSNGYKLHISIDPAYFRLVSGTMHQILHAALEEKTITSYKTFNFPPRSLEGKVPGISMTLRMMNLPFTLYLYEKFSSDNVKQLVKLVNRIEHFLGNLKSGSMETWMKADIFLTKHVTFRQACLEEDKTKYLSANDVNAEKLKSEGENSAYYKELQKALTVFCKSPLPNFWHEAKKALDALNDSCDTLEETSTDEVLYRR